MDELQQYRNHEIFYNPCVFSDEFFVDLLQPQKQPSGKPMQESLVSADATEDNAFHAAWNEMTKDPEFKTAIKQGRYTKEQLLTNFKQGRTTQISADMLGKNTESVLSRYEVTVENNAFVHRIDGEQIVVLKKSQANSDKISTDITVILNAALVIIDVVVISAALVGTIIVVRKGQLASKMKGFWPRIKEFFTHSVRNEINKLLKAEKWLQVLIRVMVVLSGSANLLRDAIKQVVTSMGFWEWVVFGASILALILLAVASAGATIGFQVAAILGYLIILGVDVKNLIDSIQDNPGRAA